MAEFGKREMGRRSFLKAAVGAAGFAIVAPQAVRGAEANSKVEVGVIGCGGRGRWIANLFAQNGNYQIVAVHDYFQERADGTGNDHKVAPERRHTGLEGYKELLAGKVDAVAADNRVNVAGTAISSSFAASLMANACGELERNVSDKPCFVPDCAHAFH